MNIRQVMFCFFLCASIVGRIQAQDFGFAFDAEDSGDSLGMNKPLHVSINGEVSATMVGFFEDFSDGLDHVALGDIFAGKLKFSASSSFAEGIINLKLMPGRLTAGSPGPLGIDEAFLRAYFGSLEISAGIRKLSWGKADSFGPLDVINPLDYSQIFVEMAENTSLLNLKISRPLVHAAFRFGEFSKIEGVFIPWFQPHLIPNEGRWAESKMAEMVSLADAYHANLNIAEPDMHMLDYAQAGLRFTTTIASADIGAQYYYGRLREPSLGGVAVAIESLGPPPKVNVDVDLLYNPYHQIGLDYAQVLFGFNMRAELAANITEDLSGDDGSIYNPFIAWSFGFDRELFLGINLNFQVNESIRLLHGEIGDKFDGDNPMSIIGGNFDIEGGQKPTSSRLTAAVSRKFLRDELELRTAAAWGIEDRDCAIMPALIWTKDDFRFALSGGIFAGSQDGQIGQYRDNHFVKISCAYTF